MVGTRKNPNNTTDTASQYKANIDACLAVDQAIAGAFACHEAATPDMTILCDAGAISFAGQVPTIVGQQTSATITAPATNPRNDLVVIDANTGVMSIITGTEAASPADPAVTEGKIPVARIALATSTTTITNANITDLRAPVLAVQGSPASLSISSNTTLTQKQAGMTVYLGGTGVTCTLASPTGCKGARNTFVGTDANTQTLSGSFLYPDGSTASSHSITTNEIVEVEATGSTWRVVSMAGKQIVKNATASTQQPIPIAQADSRYLLTSASFGGDVGGTYNAIVLAACGPGATGPVGNGTTVPVITIDAKGRVTALSSASISFPAAGVTSFNGRSGAVSLTTADINAVSDVATGVNASTFPVGCICGVWYVGGAGVLVPGATIAGTYLRENTTGSRGSNTLPGTWRVLEYAPNIDAAAGLMQRVA